MNISKCQNTTYLFIFLSCFLFSTSACSPKSGCPASENATVKVDKRGNLPKKGGKSQLFSPNGAQSIKKAQKARKKQLKRIYGR